MHTLAQMRARQAEIRARQEAIRDELRGLEALPEPEGDDAARAQVLSDRAATVDELLTEWDALDVEYAEVETSAAPLQERADRLERVRSAALDAAGREGGTHGAPAVHTRTNPLDGFNVFRASREDVRERAMRLLDAESEELVSADNKAHLAKQFRRNLSDETPNYDGDYVARRLLLTEAPAYRNAFMKSVVFGARAALNAEESAAVAAFQEFEMREAHRAASEGTNSAGGYGLPVLIDPTIILTSGAADAPILRVSRIETITTNQWKGVSSAGVVWSYDSEGSAVSDDAATLAQPAVPVYMARGFIPYSVEVGMDYPGFAAEMAKLLDQGYIDLLAAKTMTGSGSGQPTGIFTAISASGSSVQVTTTTNGSFGAPDVFKVWNALPERYRTRATWVMNVAVESAIRQFANNANNTAYFTVDLTADGVSRINGRPVIVTDYAPGTLPTTSLQNLLVVGDFSNYLIAQRAGMQVEQIPALFDTSTGRPTGQRGWFAWARNGASSVNDLGFRILQDT